MSAVEVKELHHRYGKRVALQGIDFQVPQGSIFGLLGPNGGGKTTTFRILCTSLIPTSGQALVAGHDVVEEAALVRYQIGVVFQAPSLDKKLKVKENLVHQGHLYGLSGATLQKRCYELLERVNLLDRQNEMVENLSGGLKRRVELAKGLLHDPRILLLDEPSTGLDPGARKDMWDYLHELRDRDGVTVLVTTHLMEEAERCDKLVILNEGQVVADGTPDELRAEVGGDVLLIESDEVGPLCQDIQERFGGEPSVVNDTVRIEREAGHRFVTDLIEAFPGRIQGVHLGKPTLEDVFVRRTGHRFWREPEEDS